MKKEYKTPAVKMIDLSTESPLLDTSQVGLGDGSSLGNETPTGDNDENFMSNRRDGIWGNTEW